MIGRWSGALPSEDHASPDAARRTGLQRHVARALDDGHDAATLRAMLERLGVAADECVASALVGRAIGRRQSP